MIDICYIVSHGLAVRMVLQTDLLGSLEKSGMKVAIICPDKEDNNLKNYCTKNNIRIYEINIKSRFWNAQYQDGRKYFLEDIRENPALFEKHIRAVKYNTSLNPINHIRPRLLYGVYKLREIFPKIKEWYQDREERILFSKEANDLIKKINPTILISTYPVNFKEAMLLKAAKQQNIKTLIHLLSWDNISCKGHFPCLADEYIAWGNVMKEEFESYYNISPTKIHTCGVPHFDLHTETRKNPNPQPYLLQLGISPEKPYLFFGMSSPRFAPKEIDIVEWIAAQINNGVFGNHLQLVIRPHPQNVVGNLADKSWLPRLKSLNNSRIGVDFPDLVKSKIPWSIQQYDMNKLSNLIAGSSMVFNSGSTISIDSLMCDVPVILTSFDANYKLPYWLSARRLADYNHIKKLVDTHSINVVTSFEELEKNIKELLINPYENINARRKTIKKYCSFFQGGATESVISLLKYIAEK